MKKRLKTILKFYLEKTGLPCEHDTFNAKTCMDCNAGKESRCTVYLAYRAILDLI